MAEFDLERLLAPVSDDAPTGEDLEYDPEFMELERAAAPRAERAMGDAVKAAEEPDWNRVTELSQNVLARSKDLRSAVHLTAAWLRTFGLPGWSAGLGLVRGLLETYWDGVHPQLDAEDDNDPTARVNAVAEIANPLGVLGYLRQTPFVESPRLGRFSLRDLRIATGTLKVGSEDNDEALPTMTDIEACCLDCDEATLAAALQALEQASEHARAIDGLFNEQVGTLGPELKPLLSDHHELLQFVRGQSARRNPEQASDADADAETGEEAGAEAPAKAAKAASGRIESPQDVVRRLDDICDYFARCEPSSPIPLLLRRARRLVGMNFADLMRELAPSGLSELQVISGSEDGEG